MLKLFKHLKPYVWLIIPLVILTYLQVMANLQLPDYMAKIINDGIIGESMNAIYRNGGIMLLVTLGGGIAAVGVGFLATRVATSFTRDIRRKVFEKVESFSIAEFNSYQPHRLSLVRPTTSNRFKWSR